MLQKNSIKISLIGSCVIRDAFEIPISSTNTGEYIIERFIQSINPISAVSEKLCLDSLQDLLKKISVSNATNFYKRNFTLDIQKTCFEYLSEVKSDYLIIDITPIRIPLESLDGTYITQGLKKEVLKEIGSPDKIIDICDLSKQDFTNYMKAYVNKITELYTYDRIIVVDMINTNILLNNNHVCYAQDDITQRYEKENERINRAFELLKKILPNAHYIDRLPLLLGNQRHKWGACGMHYIDDTYQYLLECIDFICHQKNVSTKYSEKEQLDEIRWKYTNRIIQKYNKAVLSSLKSYNNIFKFDIGLIPGTYESNGVKLTINNDYSFDVSGTATNDVVFYLYSKHKNPIREWSSALFNLSKGKYIFSTGNDISKDSFYIQLVLANNENDRRWIWGARATRFEIDHDYRYMLVRLIVKNGYEIDAKGFLRLEKI